MFPHSWVRSQFSSLFTFHPQQAQFSAIAPLLHRSIVQLIRRTPSVFDVVKHDGLNAEYGDLLKQGEVLFDPSLRSASPLCQRSLTSELTRPSPLQNSQTKMDD